MFSKNFSFEIKPKRPKEVGYFAFSLALAFEGKVTAGKPIINVTIKNDKELEAALELKVTESISSKIGVKAKDENIAKIIQAVKAKDKKMLMKAIAEILALDTAVGGKINDYVDAKMGVQFDLTPFFIKVSGTMKETYFLGQPVEMEAKVEGGFLVGPSKKAWALIARKLGAEAVKRFLISVGGRCLTLLSSLTAAGVLTATVIIGVAVGGTIGLLALTAKLVGNAHTRGTMIGLATWYRSAYIAKVFDNRRPEGYVLGNRYVPDANEIKKMMIAEGELDAVRDAIDSARRFGDTDIKSATPRELLDRYKYAWLNKYSVYSNNYNYHQTKRAFELMLNKKIKSKFNIEMF
jgi:hypothetical protein